MLHRLRGRFGNYNETFAAPRVTEFALRYSLLFAGVHAKGATARAHLVCLCFLCYS